MGQSVEAFLAAGLQRLAKKPLGRLLRRFGGHGDIDRIRAVDFDGALNRADIARLGIDRLLIHHAR